MYKLHEKSPQRGTERFKKVFTRGLNRFVPFRSILRLTFQSRPLFGTERNVSSRSRVNTCKNSFVFWNSSTSFRSVPFSCERGPRLRNKHIKSRTAENKLFTQAKKDYYNKLDINFVTDNSDNIACVLTLLAKSARRLPIIGNSGKACNASQMLAYA